ncbi:hypothetical protein VTK73DRAFT_4027 [Phialemonium thermophilum]|uniref:LysM domain-containing protein n=1 Tax=Phialemonium thermophilum TaxID=223376 RepID=A0ABR3WWA4_9PEZI
MMLPSSVAAVLAALVVVADAAVTTLTSPTGPQQTGTISSCNKWYTVVAGDSCSTVAADFGITVAQFLAWNPAVDATCTVNFWAGYTYCVGVSSGGPTTTTTTTKTTPTSKSASGTAETTPNLPTMSGIPCNCNLFYDVVAGDSCATVEAKFGITLDQFLAWNPTVSKDCATNFWVGESYCVGVSNESCKPTTKTTIKTTGTATVPPSSVPPNTLPYSTLTGDVSASLVDRPTATGWPPQPTLSGTAANCLRYYYVSPGDTCASVVSLYSSFLTLKNFLAWNPAVGSDCSGLYVNYYYCVDVPYAGTLPNATTQVLPSWTPPSLPSLDPSVSLPSPTASGFPRDCQSWYQAVQGDSCDSILANFTYLAQSDFLSWNPSVSCPSGIAAGTYYCVADYPPDALPPPETVTVAPSPTQTGIASSCKAWYLASDGDSCSLIPQYFGTFSESDFLSWNPALKADCSGLVVGDYYCVAVPGTPTTRTAPLPTTTTLPSNGVGPQPEQTGIPSSCTGYWLVSPSDNCTYIAQINGITEKELHDWNPALGDDCEDLRPDYYICVGAPAGASGTGSPPTGPASSPTGKSTTSPSSTTPTTGPTRTPPPSTTTTTKTTPDSPATTTTTTGSAISTPRPTQSGMVAGCRRFYLVESGDDCFDIAQDAGISLDDFYADNPAVGTSCNGLLAGYFVCVGTSGPAATLTSGPPVGPTPRPVQVSLSFLPPSHPHSAALAYHLNFSASRRSLVLLLTAQTGMVSGCSRFYLVEGGDNCLMIAADAGIALNDFYSWNPAVGTSCQGLQAGVYVCIGTSGVPATTITSGHPVSS